LKKVTLKEIIYKQQKKCWLMKTDIVTDDLDNMSRRDLVELLEAYNESLAEVKRLREGIGSYLNLEIETHELKELIE